MRTWQRQGWRRALILAGGLALSACLGGGSGDGGGSGGGRPTDDGPFLASGPTPFGPGCDGAPGIHGVLYADSEVEPMIAVDPRDPNHLIGVWQQDRWSDGAAQGLLAAVTFDGGRTWERHEARFTRCSGGNVANGGDYERASDPWVAFGADGIAYQIALAVQGETFAAGSKSAILVSRSLDRGRSWSDPATLISDDSRAFNDKESITVDPTDPRLVYATWDRLDIAGGGPAYLSRSTDRGATWEPARPIFDPGRNGQTINNQIVVLPDGTLVDFFTQYDYAVSMTEIVVIRSLDKGQSWSRPIRIATVLSVGTTDPETGRQVRDASNLGAIAVGPRGELVTVWQDARFSGGAYDGIALSRSVDGGLSWSAPVRINGDPTAPAFVPSVAVRPDGTIGVAYFDFRNNMPAQAIPTDYWLAQSTNGVTWTETHVAGPFDLALAPDARGLFLGDYQGLAISGATFVPLYAVTNDGAQANRTDIFAARAAVPGTVVTAKAAPAMVAPSAPEFTVTPELTQRISAAARRTLSRRGIGTESYAR